MAVPIKGWNKTSLVDFPPYTASTIFLGGCNFRCPYCHNPDLVLNFKDILDIPEKEILQHLESKKMWLDGVCITGGEPTIHKDLPEFISKIKKLGLLVKLDTNGMNPLMLKELIDKKLVDRFAMDIKTSLEEYDEVADAAINKQTIQKSIDLIKNSGIGYEFRTTVVPGLVGKEQIKKIGEWLKGSKRFAIQNFRGTMPTLNKEFQNKKSYSKQELLEMKQIAEKYFEKVEIRD